MKRLITLSVCLFAVLGIVKADHDQPININQLPKKSQEFITQYFPKNEVSYAKMEKEFLDKKYEVVFVNGEKIEFGKSGEWEKVDCKFSVIPAAIIPQAIKDHVAKQYPQATVLKIERDSKGYEVNLSNKLELKFSPKFQLIEIDN